MKSTKSNQTGFSIVEAVIVVAVIGIIGAAGWFVYHQNQVKTSEAAANNQTTNQQTTTPPTPTTTYFSIMEWGVRAPYSGSLKLTYKVATSASGGGSAVFSSDQLTAIDPNCADRGGKIIRYAATDKVSAYPSDPNEPTADQAFAGKDSGTLPYAHIGNYYYVFAHDQAACDDPSVTGPLQAQTNDAVKALVSSLQAIPN